MGHPRRGEFYWVDFSPVRGSEQGGTRPAVVISGNAANRLFDVVTVASVTSKIKERQSALVVLLPKGKPLKEESAIMPFQVLTVSNMRLDGRCIGTLTPAQTLDLDDKLRLVWGLREP